MSETIIDNKSAALVFNEDGSINLLLPTAIDGMDTVVPSHVQFATVLMVLLYNDDGVLNEYMLEKWKEYIKEVGTCTS